MQLLLRLITGIVILAVVLIGVAFLLPREVQVARSVTIDAAPDQIFPHVNSMQKTEGWSPWLDRDPDVALTYEGPEMGVGNKMSWDSENPQVGNGTQIITASVENERVETDLDFGPMGIAKASFVLTPADDGTLVTWGFTTDLGMNPMARWMGLMMDRWVGGDYETGLGNLKTLVESDS